MFDRYLLDLISAIYFFCTCYLGSTTFMPLRVFWSFLVKSSVLILCLAIWYS